MGIVERARELLLNPPADTGHLGIQEKQNRLVRAFMEGKMGLEILRVSLVRLHKADSAPAVILPYPGPLYGLLRKIGFSEKEALAEIVDEERAHYAAAQKAGLATRVILRFSKDEKSGKFFFNVYTAYEIPEGIDEEKLREIITKISLAPQKPSDDDLAKLPEKT